MDDQLKSEYLISYAIIIKGFNLFNKKEIEKQLNILMIRWMNMLKNFIQIKSKKTMTYHYSHCLFIATYYEKRYLYH
ncbi:MAG: hypothetical protein ACLUD4_03505, partial [Thomasclavelia spiroformis]